MKRKKITFEGRTFMGGGEWRKIKPESNKVTKEFMVEDLRFVVHVLKKNNIEYFSSWGTLLGLIREGDIIEGDDDLDFYFDAKDEKRLIDAFLKYDRVTYYNIYCPIKSPYNIVQFRIPRKEFTTLIDFYPYENTEKDYVIDYYNHADYLKMVSKEECVKNKTALHLPKRYIFPLIEADFKNCTAKIPNDPVAMLEWFYGDTWTKKLEKGKGYKQEIKNNAIITKMTQATQHTLSISDRLNNGKHGGGFIDFDMHFYDHECKIHSGVLYANDTLVDLNKVKSIILNFNEVTPKSDHTFFKQIAKLIKDEYPHIIIYNDPHRCVDFGDKLKVYDKIKHIHFEIFSVPEYRAIGCVEDIEAVNFFPNIIKVTNGSHTKEDSLSNDKQELIDNYNKKFKNKKNVFCVEYMNSYIDSLESYCGLRFLIFNNEIVDYLFRPSDNWNVHSADQKVEKMREADVFFKEFLEKNRDSINHDINILCETYGNGFFAHDFVLSNNRLYICELGLKFFDWTAAQSRVSISAGGWVSQGPSLLRGDKLALSSERLRKYYIEKITK